MTRRQKDPLRALTDEERTALSRLSRSPSAPAAQVARATALLAVAEGQSYTVAAQRVGRRHGDTVAAWVGRFTLPEQLPPLRLLLVWDNLAGHKTPEMVLWLCQHGIMPLYTPLGGSPAGPFGPACSAAGSGVARWLNMAEAIQRILKRRALDGQQPQSPEEIGAWFEQTARGWNRQPTPFIWNGKRRQRRRRAGDSRSRLGGAAAHTCRPLQRKPPTRRKPP